MGIKANDVGNAHEHTRDGKSEEEVRHDNLTQEIVDALTADQSFDLKRATICEIMELSQERPAVIVSAITNAALHLSTELQRV